MARPLFNVSQCAKITHQNVAMRTTPAKSTSKASKNVKFRRNSFQARNDEMDEESSYPDCDEDKFSRIEAEIWGQPRLKDPLAPGAFSLPVGAEDDPICKFRKCVNQRATLALLGLRRQRLRHGHGGERYWQWRERKERREGRQAAGNC